MVDPVTLTSSFFHLIENDNIFIFIYIYFKVINNYF